MGVVTGLASTRKPATERRRAGRQVDRDRAAQVRRARAAIGTSAALQVRAEAAVAHAVAVMSSVASCRGDRFRSAGAPSAAGPVSRGFTIAGVGAVRGLVTDAARRAGLSEPAQWDFVLAVQELVVNAIRHGGGRGRVLVRTDGDALVCAVADRGPGITGAVADMGMPAPDTAEGGRGLFLARELTDSIDISTGAAGTVVTVTMNLPRAQPPDGRSRRRSPLVPGDGPVADTVA